MGVRARSKITMRRWACVAAVLVAARAGAAATPGSTGDGLLQLHLIPHTHADVGWLQTVDSLSRVNVSRILNGVVGNLANDTLKRRRFVWDEMAFLQLWWDEQATEAQKQQFTQLVAEKRIEFTDNGWSQHDMGCTTLDSMVSNWVEGHQWLLDTFGETAQPKVGWSLDPFGLSGSQAVLQALMGMEAWFFTRVGDDVVAQMKKDKSVEFVWRASSSLPAAQSEIFAHVFESYYCMPLPTYAFEWGKDLGAKVPNAGNVVSLAQGLAKIALQRAEWFRTPNVAIPWGCDYQYQNAELVYNSTDWIIDEINAHPEWGVHVQYATPSEYLAAIKSDATAADTVFPVKEAGTSFFPYNSWSGYFTSRPSLKGHSQAAVSQLLAAETLFALHSDAPGNCSTMWSNLETARRNNGIVQHHDAITGTGCSNGEGCSGKSQDTGPHNVIADYQDMLSESMTASAAVISNVLTFLTGSKSNLSLDPAVLGKILMGGGDGGDDAMFVVYNPLAVVRTEAVNIQVPVCALQVFDADSGNEITAQVTAQIGISDGIAPFYDFELQFEASDLPPLGFKRYRISPKADATCHGGDMQVRGLATVTHHQSDEPGPKAYTREEVIAEAMRRQGDACGNVDRWHRLMQEVEGEFKAHKPQPKPVCRNVVLQNSFLQVFVDLCTGVAAVYDVASHTNYSLTHELMLWPSTKNDAYGAGITTAVPVLINKTVSATVAMGPILQEVWLQISPEHKTRIRVWNSADPEVGGRIEFGHRIGVLDQFSEVSSRFTLGTSSNWTLYSEDNGYEKVPHQPPPAGYDTAQTPSYMYPSQMSVFGATDIDQLSLALERSHAVGSLVPGTVEVMQHRRGGPYTGSGMTVVLDDVDRIFTQTWLSVGKKNASNRMRVAMRQRLNHPLVLAAGYYQVGAKVKTLGGGPVPLPTQVHLQGLRATDPKSSDVLVRLQHLYATGEDPVMSAAVDVDLDAFLASAGVEKASTTEVTLDGMRNVDTTCSRPRYPADVADDGSPSRCSGDKGTTGTVTVSPFEVRTFRVTRS